jgi:hypothetical protein
LRAILGAVLEASEGKWQGGVGAGQRRQLHWVAGAGTRGSVDGAGPRGAASELSGARLRAGHLGERPASLIGAGKRRTIVPNINVPWTRTSAFSSEFKRGPGAT